LLMKLNFTEEGARGLYLVHPTGWWPKLAETSRGGEKGEKPRAEPE